ncbi:MULTISPECIES: ParA family protein [Burkholderia]|uniref:ParA family protein n=1 Tax=Burkholderia TaxID=32008 RepID=UPI0009F4AA47|nr:MULTISPECIES: ParA family protein [Burkholderia]RQR71729.1 ParA family protein [Burkholderia sp. Bp9015]
MTARISLFNHKGGVSKTTTTFNLGWKLGQMGHRVLLVDADPQCNLSGLILGAPDDEQLVTFYRGDSSQRNIRAGLAPAFESQPRPIQAVECVDVPGQANMFLLPGHIRLSEYEVTLGIAQELSGSIQTLQNLPGALSHLIDATAERYNADFVLIDMNPGLGSINQNLLMTSDFFIVPTTPDYFSVMALESLTSILPRWRAWSIRAQQNNVLQSAAYPYPTRTPKFLGTVVQKYRPRGGAPTAGFQRWIDDINRMVSGPFQTELSNAGMMLPLPRYQEAYGTDTSLCLCQIADFNTLIAKSQDKRTPVFALTDEQFETEGVVLESYKRQARDFDEVFTQLANRICQLTRDE